MEWKKYFKNTKYINWYFKIIEKALNDRMYQSGIHEHHHILPRSLFPEFKNDKTNLVVLTFREHFICHVLLWKHYKKINDKKAIIKMGHVLVKMKYFYLNSHKYDYAKKAQSQSRLLEGSAITNEGRKRISENMKKNNPAKELKLCPYCKRKIPLNNYYQYHGDFCKENPNKIINFTILKKYEKIKKATAGKASYRNCFTFEIERINKKDLPKWYHLPVKGNSYVWVIYKNKKILHIFCNITSAEHFLKKFNRKIWFFKENYKRNKIYTKNNYKKNNSLNFIKYFENCTFERFRVKDLTVDFFIKNKEKIYNLNTKVNYVKKI